MADPSRGFKSLRKKRTERPKISNPTLQEAVTPRTRSEDREKLQRRMSQRLMVPIGTENAPPMPSLPPQMAGYPQAAGQIPAADSSGRHHVDMSAFEDPNLDAESYVRSLLANSSLEDIDRYENELTKIKNRASADLQQNVHKNIDAFIKVSQHVKTTKSEMDKLRNLIAELRVTIAQSNAALGIDVDDDKSASRKYANRSSIANLEALWSSQLQELWKRVEGSQKYLPAIPGRHVIHESPRWMELNSATWKPRRRVHLILLNDHFLAASEKKRVDQSPQVGEEQSSRALQGSSQLVADHCFSLNDVEVSDFREKTGTSATMTKFMAQAVVIRYGTESLTYAAVDTDRAGNEKAAFVGKTRKAVANIRKALLLDAAESNPALRPTSANGMNSMTGSFTPSAPQRVSAKPDALVEVDGKQENFRWVENQIYELEIDVALQRFELAVSRVEKLRGVAKANKSNIAVQALLEAKAQEHIDKLVEWLTHYLKLDQKARTKVMRNTAWLIRLDLEQLASHTYLEARSEWIKLLVE